MGIKSTFIASQFHYKEVSLVATLIQTVSINFSTDPLSQILWKVVTEKIALLFKNLVENIIVALLALKNKIK